MNIKQYPLELENKLHGFHFKKQPSIKIQHYLERIKKKKSTEDFDRYWNIVIPFAEKIYDYCGNMEAANGHDYQVSVDLKKLITDYDGRMENISFYDLGDGNSFWQGILSLYPWHELEMEEEQILEIILHHHVFTNGSEIFFDFNKQSPIDKFLRKNWEGDTIVNTVMILRRVVRGAIDMLKKDDAQYPRYLKFKQSGYCPTCECSFYEDSGKCPECKSNLEYR